MPDALNILNTLNHRRNPNSSTLKFKPNSLNPETYAVRRHSSTQAKTRATQKKSPWLP